MEKHTHTHTHMRASRLFCCIFSVQSLRPWKYVGMDNGYNVPGSLLVSTETDCSHIFEWFILSPFRPMLVTSYPSHWKKGRVITRVVFYWRFIEQPPLLPRVNVIVRLFLVDLSKSILTADKTYLATPTLLDEMSNFVYLSSFWFLFFKLFAPLYHSFIILDCIIIKVDRQNGLTWFSLPIRFNWQLLLVGHLDGI